MVDLKEDMVTPDSLTCHDELEDVGVVIVRIILVLNNGNLQKRLRCVRAGKQMTI